jgi:hypothetical protein
MIYSLAQTGSVLGQNTKLLGENIYFLKHRLTASSIFA